MVEGLNRVVRVFPDADTAATAASERLVDLAERARGDERPFALALSGGRTPEPLFRALASRPDGPRLWPAWQLFWADERLVPGSDPRNNAGLARRLWLGPSGFPPAGIHAIDPQGSGTEVAIRYEAVLRQYFAGTPATFDAVVLGVGGDGHTASLFPGSPALEEAGRWVTAVPRPGQPPYVPRITLTLPALAKARVALFLVTGPEKQPIVSRLLGPDERDRAELPPARVQPKESVEWFLDVAAAPAPATPGESLRPGTRARRDGPTGS